MFKHIENIGTKILMFFSFVFSILNVQKIDTFDQNLDLENFLDFFQDRILREGMRNSDGGSHLTNDRTHPNRNPFFGTFSIA